MSKTQKTSLSLSSKPTPMMAQFLNVKSQYQDFLLFYRMGDFYEMFFHDAEIVSGLLGIVLTKRGQMNGLVGEIIPHLLKNINEIKSNG